MRNLISDMPLLSRRQLLVASAALGLPAALPTDLVFAASRTSPLPTADAATLGFLPYRLTVADAIVAEAVASGGVPGAVLLVGRRGAVTFRKAYGQAVLRPGPVPMTTDTVFDLASLTKAVGTTSAVMQLIEQNRVGLDTLIAAYLSPFAEANDDRATRLTVRHLLTHTSGFPAGGAYSGKTRMLAQSLDEIAQSRVVHAPGERFLYSDFNFRTSATSARPRCIRAWAF